MAKNEAVVEQTLIDANSAALMCGMHRASWYKAVASGKAPAGVRIGGMVRWRKAELESWIAHDCPPQAKWENFWSKRKTG